MAKTRVYETKKVGESSHKLEHKKAVNPAINWN